MKSRLFSVIVFSGMRYSYLLAIICSILIMQLPARAELDAAAKAEIDNATKAIHSAPTAVNYAERGRLYGRNKMFQLSLQDYNRAIKLMPNEPGLYWRRAVDLSQLARYREAIADCNRTLRLCKQGDDDYLNALRGRAHCYDELGFEKEAKADLYILRNYGDTAAAADLREWGKAAKSSHK